MTKLNKQINEAVDVLRKGGCVVFPTETSYGLAADATDAQAVGRLKRIKGRGSKTLPVIVADLKMAKQYVQIQGLALDLAKRFWPGALTIVLKKKRNKEIKKEISECCVRDEQIAIRVSEHPVARELSKKLGRPIVATSANRSGQPDCYSVRAVRSQYKSQKLQPDYYLDVKALPKRKPSTLVQVQDNKLKILRQGSVCLPKSLLDNIG